VAGVPRVNAEVPDRHSVDCRLTLEVRGTSPRLRRRLSRQMHTMTRAKAARLSRNAHLLRGHDVTLYDCAAPIRFGNLLLRGRLVPTAGAEEPIGTASRQRRELVRVPPALRPPRL